MTESTDQVPGAPPETPTPAPEPSPGATPEPAPPPTPPGAAAEPDAPDEDEDAPDLTPDELRSELDRARRSAARYRTERNTLRDQVAQLTAQLAQAATPAPPADESAQRIAAAERRALIAEEAAAAGIPLDAIRTFRRLDQAETPEAVTQALSDLRAFLAGTPSGIPRPPGAPSQPASLDEQIRAAEGSKNISESLRLKAAKLQQVQAAAAKR